MAAPSYTHDLTTYNDCTDATNWDELTGMAASAPPDIDTDLAIHGSICITADRAKVGLSSQVYDGAGITLATGECIFLWHKFFAPNSLSTLSLGGVRVMIGDSLTVYDGWYMDGSDTYPYGGWVNYVVDPTTSPDQTNGTTTGAYSTIGNGWNLPTQAPQKGNPFGTDIIRYGRGESIFTDGDLGNGYATFDGYALVNDNPTTGRLGLFQSVGGSYLYKGLMSLGTASTPVDFRDSDVTITIDDTTKVSSTFNAIEINNASSRVDWTNIILSALGTASPGSFTVVDDADVNIIGCAFANMGAFIFATGSTMESSRWNNCGLITQGGSSFDLCEFSDSPGAVTLLSDNPAVISNCIFNSDGSNHAIEVSATGSYTFTGNSFNDYAGGTAGSTGNECIYNNSGGFVEINVVEGDTPSWRDGAGASTQINNNVSVTLTGMPDLTEVRVYAAGTINQLAGIEIATAGVTASRTFSFSLPVATNTDIRLINKTYEVYELYDFEIPSTSSSIPISLRFDRNYQNN